MTDHPLQLSGTVHTSVDADTLYDDLAHALMGAALAATRERGVFHLAVSGGKSPEPFFMRLVTDPRYRLIPWKLTHLWMVDERCVPPEDERSNWKMIKETLANHVGIKKRQLHPIPVMEKDPASVYERELLEVMEEAGDGDAPAGAIARVRAVPRLDFVQLGMGDDGHTASLFPHSAALHEKQRLIVANDGPHVTPPPRVTMTYPLLNAARALAVLVIGENKNPALRRVAQQLARGPDPETLPITGIMPTTGQLTWFLDHAAAGVSKGESI